MVSVVFYIEMLSACIFVHIFCVFMLSDIMLSVTMLSDVMLTAFMLSIVILSAIMLSANCTECC